MSVEHYSEIGVFVVCTSTKKEVEVVQKGKVKLTCPKCQPVGNNRQGKFCSLCGTENIVKASIEKVYKKIDWSPSLQDASYAMELMGEKLIFPACAAYDHLEDYGEILFKPNPDIFSIRNEGLTFREITTDMIVDLLNRFKIVFSDEIAKLIEMFGESNVQIKFGLFSSYS